MADEVLATKESGVKTLPEVFDDSDVEDHGGRRRRKRLYVDLKCPFCESGVKSVSYKDVYQLKKYTSIRGKIIGRDKSGMCARHQRQLTSSVRKARYMALLPYVSVTK